MAKPRVFVCSTYYDLKHIRSSLELFIEGLGYDPVLSEKGDIAYLPDDSLDESCYREASTADILVLIIGGKGGSVASNGDQKPPRSFFEPYESITSKEFETAYEEGIPIYVLIESGVHSEYRTYLRNKGNEGVKYAHVDSVNVFKLVEEIESKPRNNPMYPFEQFAQIESWLKEQWAGLFRELLKTRKQQKQLLALTGQVGELKAVSETLKTYLEAVLKGTSRDESIDLIEKEEERLQESKRLELLRANYWCDFVQSQFGISLDDFVEIMKRSNEVTEFAEEVSTLAALPRFKEPIIDIFRNFSGARDEFNEARRILGLDPVESWCFPPRENSESPPNSNRKRTSPSAD